MIKYVSAFFAILLLGATADVPVMFLGITGVLSLYFVFIGGFLVDICSDLFWYWLGHKIGIERFEKIKFFRQKPERMEALGHALKKYGMAMLIISKFINAFGIPTQIITGAHHYPLKKMLLANAIGSGSFLLVIYSLARIFASEMVVEKYLKNANIALLVFFVILTVFHFALSSLFDKLLLPKKGKKGDSSSN